MESIRGRGTVFEIFFPAIKRAEPQAVFEDAPLRGGHERILVVDDEPALTEILSKILERMGYEVEGLTNVEDALAIFRGRAGEKPFDLVITDMTMPRVTGIELAEKLHCLQPNLPIILCTGFSEKITLQKIKSLGIRAVLMKPVSPQELSEAVRKALDERSE